jgi:hypothetical protein
MMRSKDAGLHGMRENLLRGADCHELQLRANYRVQVVIPRDFTKAEAARLCAFVQSLAQPDAQQARAG